MALLAACFMLVFCLTYSSTLKMEATFSSETSVDFQRPTRRIPEDRKLHNHRCENLKSYIFAIDLFKFKHLSVLRQVHSLFQSFGERLTRKSYNVVVFPFAFHMAVQQPLKPLWSRLLLCDHEPSQPSPVLCFMSLLMSLLPASVEF
jgi:hypothetical protein